MEVYILLEGKGKHKGVFSVHKTRSGARRKITVALNWHKKEAARHDSRSYYTKASYKIITGDLET